MQHRRRHTIHPDRAHKPPPKLPSTHPPTPPTAPSPDEDLHTRSSLDREEKLPSALCTPQVEESPYIVKLRVGRRSKSILLLKHHPKLHIAPGHPPHLPKKHIIGLKNALNRFLLCQSLPRWAGVEPGDR